MSIENDLPSDNIIRIQGGGTPDGFSPDDPSAASSTFPRRGFGPLAKKMFDRTISGTDVPHQPFFSTNNVRPLSAEEADALRNPER